MFCNHVFTYGDEETEIEMNARVLTWCTKGLKNSMIHFKVRHCFQIIAGSLYLLKISSMPAVTSAGKGRSVVRKASMSSFSCSTEIAPIMELVMNGRSRANPRASWTGVKPCFLANSTYFIVASWKRKQNKACIELDPTSVMLMCSFLVE